MQQKNYKVGSQIKKNISVNMQQKNYKVGSQIKKNISVKHATKKL